uniref:Predicted protein n=1 Tax=Hordeum vulgare subsp. vulgare TaxID=112509 RepID=F2DZI6_HORVV|nr:predicted protein [Hordeum vulgare subsp. vulgare]
MRRRPGPAAAGAGVPARGLGRRARPPAGRGGVVLVGRRRGLGAGGARCRLRGPDLGLRGRDRWRVCLWQHRLLAGGCGGGGRGRCRVGR